MRARQQYLEHGRRPAVVGRMLTLAAVLVLAGPAPVRAAPPMATRLVTVFGQKERALHTALASGDLTVLDALVSRNFEARLGEQPGRPIPRAEWLQTSVASQYPGRLEQMAVRAIGPAALVSFQWAQAGSASKVMVVDLWDGDDDNAHLITRYATVLGKSPTPGQESDGTRPRKR